MPIYMKIDGVEGDVVAKGYEKWIEVYSYSFGGAVTPPTSGGGAGKSFFNPMYVDFPVSSGVPKTMFFAMAGRNIKSVTVVVVGNLGDQQREHSRYVLQNVLISSYSVSGSDGSRPTENLSFNFERITWYETLFAGDGSVRGQNYAWWSIVENRGGINH